MTSKSPASMALLVGSALGVALILSGAFSAAGRPNVFQSTGLVIVLKTGAGTVSSVNSTAIQCGTRCTARLPLGTRLVLTASKTPRWEGACVGSAPLCEFVVAETRAVVRVSFVSSAKPPWNTLKVSIGGQGKVQSDVPNLIDCPTTSCSTALSRGIVTLRATPNQDSFFVGWSGSCTGRSRCEVELTASQEVRATFRRRDVVDGMSTLRVSRNGDVGSIHFGSSVCPDVCTGRFANRSLVTLVVREGLALFDNWSGSCKGTASTCVLAISGTESTTAFFSTQQKKRAAVNVTRSGKGVVESSPPGILCGTGDGCSASFSARQVELTATAARDYILDRWGGEGANCARQIKCTVPPREGGASVSVLFVLADELRVTKAGDGGGTVTSLPRGIDCGAICVATFGRGTSVELLARPDDNSRFVGWAGACSGGGSCRVVLNGTRSVTARFGRICAASSATGFSARIAKGPRRVLVTIRLEGRVSARLRLLRGTKTVAEKKVATLPRGLRNLRLNVPRGAATGTYRVVLRLSDPCGRVRTFDKTVKVPRT